jgi:hypothetical protein
MRPPSRTPLGKHAIPIALTVFHDASDASSTSSPRATHRKHGGRRAPLRRDLEVDAEGITVPREAVLKVYSSDLLGSTVTPVSRQ